MNKFIRLSTLALWVMAFSCALPSAVAQVITATITITNNVPITNSSGAWIAIQGSRLTWTNRSVAALLLNTRAISATNPPSYAATNLSNKLRSLFTPSLAFGWNNSTSIVVRAGQGKSLSISNSSGWASISLDTSTPSYSTWPATLGASNVQGVAFTLGGSTIYNWTDIGGGPTSGVTAQIATNIALSQAQVVAATNIPPINVNVITNTQATGQISSVVFDASGATTPDSFNAGELNATNIVSTVVTGIRIYSDDFYGTLQGAAQSAATATFAVSAGSASQLSGDNGSLFLQAPGGVAGSFNAGALTNNHPGVIGALPANARAGEFRDTGTNLFIGSTNANGGAVQWKEVVTTTNNHSAGKIPVGQGDGNIAWLDTNAIAGTGVSDGDKANITVADSGASYVVRSNTVPFNFLSNTPTASASLSGILSATDWTTFNNKQPGNANTTNWALFPTNILSLRQPADADLTNWANTATGVVLHASSAAGLYQPLDGDLSTVAALGINAIVTNGSSPTFRIVTAETQYLGQVISTNFSVLSNASPQLPPNHAATLWRSNGTSLFIIQNNGGTYYTNLAIVPDGTVTNLQSGVSFTNGAFQGNFNGQEIRVDSLVTGMNTNATPAYSLVTINSNRFTSSSLIAGLSGDWILTNLGNGFNIWTKVTGGNANTNAWASNATAHVFVKNSVGTFIFTNDTFESSKPWRVQVPAATAGSVTNFQMQFWRNYTNGAFASESSPSNISYGNIGSMATFTPTLATFTTNVAINGKTTLGGGTAGSAIFEINATNYPGVNSFLINFAGGSVTIDDIAGVRITGSLTLAIPASHPALLRQAMFNFAPDVTYGMQALFNPYAIPSHHETIFSGVINNVTAETNVAFPDGMRLYDVQNNRGHTNEFATFDFYNWISPYASIKFISGTTNAATNALMGIGITNNLLTIGPLHDTGVPTNSAISINNNGNVSVNGAMTISTNTVVTAPPLHSMTLWNSNGINLWLIKNSAGTLTTNLIN